MKAVDSDTGTGITLRIFNGSGALPEQAGYPPIHYTDRAKP